MINPMTFMQSPDPVFAAALRVAALRVAADLVADGKGRHVEFLGMITPQVLEGEASPVYFFRLQNLATGERWYQAPGGTRL